MTTPSIDDLKRGADDVSVGIILYKTVNGRPLFLLMKHNKGGHWGAPKGHIETGETPLDCAFRETREECGVTLESVDADFFEFIDYPVIKDGREITKRSGYFLARIPSDIRERLSDEHNALVWLPVDSAMKKVHENFAAVLKKANERITNVKNS